MGAKYEIEKQNAPRGDTGSPRTQDDRGYHKRVREIRKPKGKNEEDMQD